MESRLFIDTSDFFSINVGDVIQIGKKRYRVTGYERERRFGISDPKLWVKRAVDADTGEKRIIKLSFFESFETQLGGVKIRRFRNPKKEGDILEFVKDHPCFMHGKSFTDPQKNSIRVIEIVTGKNLLMHIDAIKLDHKTYFYTVFPGILKKLIRAFEAILLLHQNGFKHGDVRSDHIIVESNTGNYVWIDFDYDYDTDENPFSLDIFEIGNILLYAMGKGYHDRYMIENDTNTYKDLRDRIKPEDFSILHKWRFVDLQKLYPYIPIGMNNILRHFSMGTEIFYESVEEILDDLKGCADSFIRQ